MVDQFMVKKRFLVIHMLIVKIFGKLMPVFIFVDHLNHYQQLEIIILIHIHMIILMMNFNINNKFFVFSF